MLTGQGAVINMPSVQGELVFEICATLTELERELTLECAKAGFAGARETSRLNDAAETPTDVASTRHKPEIGVAALYMELETTHQALYGQTSLTGKLRGDG